MSSGMLILIFILSAYTTTKNRLETANICREVLTEEVFKLINK